MRRLILAAIAAAAVVSVGALTTAGATPLANPEGPRQAIEDTDLTGKVHCRWGYPHHLRRWGWWDGCYRGLRRGYIVAPVVVFIGPRRHWRRRFW